MPSICDLKSAIYNFQFQKYVVRQPLPTTTIQRSICITPKEVLTLIREKEVKAIDLRFVDLPGTWQHFTIPPKHLEE